MLAPQSKNNGIIIARARRRKVWTAGVFGVLSVVCLIIITWHKMCNAPSDSCDTEITRKGRFISEATSATKPENNQMPVAAIHDDVAPKKHANTYFDENGIERYPGGARVPRANPKKVTFPDRRAVKWAFDCEDEISALIDMEPGDVVVGDMEYGDAFIIDFNNSLTNKIVVSKDDDPYSRHLKEGVIAAKQDLYDAMCRGENIAEIMTATRREMRSLFEYKSMLEEEILNISSSSEYTDDDIDDFVKAANRMLENKGIAPIKMPRMLLNKFKKR